MKQDNPDVMIGRSVLQDVPTCDNVEQLSTDNNLYEQNTVGFSDTTVRMNSLMGRGNPLELFNQESLASINEAPESEWPILHASGGSGRGRIGNIILSGSNPQRCHLDGPPAPEHSIHQSLLSHNLVAFLAQEMNPPVHLLNTGTPGKLSIYWDPNPYGFPCYSFPLMFPGPMLPWPYYHPMNGGAAFMLMIFIIVVNFLVIHVFF